MKIKGILLLYLLISAEIIMFTLQFKSKDNHDNHNLDEVMASFDVAVAALREQAAALDLALEINMADEYGNMDSEASGAMADAAAGAVQWVLAAVQGRERGTVPWKSHCLEKLCGRL